VQKGREYTHGSDLLVCVDAHVQIIGLTLQGVGLTLQGVGLTLSTPGCSQLQGALNLFLRFSFASLCGKSF